MTTIEPPPPPVAMRVEPTVAGVAVGAAVAYVQYLDLDGALQYARIATPNLSLERAQMIEESAGARVILPPEHSALVATLEESAGGVGERYIYEVRTGDGIDSIFVCADGAGWIPGTYPSAEEAGAVDASTAIPTRDRKDQP